MTAIFHSHKVARFIPLTFKMHTFRKWYVFNVTRVISFGCYETTLPLSATWFSVSSVFGFFSDSLGGYLGTAHQIKISKSVLYSNRRFNAVLYLFIFYHMKFNSIWLREMPDVLIAIPWNSFKKNLDYINFVLHMFF